MSACSRDREWYYYIIASLITFFGGLILIIPARIIWYAWYEKRRTDDYEHYQKHRHTGTRGCFARIRATVQTLVQGHNTTSRCMVVLFWLINMASVLLYLVEATLYSVEDCGQFFSDPAQYAWLAFACIFLVHYIIRFLAAPDKLTVWLDIYSLVDHFTIPHIFMGLFLDKNWIGFKFLRMLYLLQTPEIMEILSVIKTRQNIRLVQVMSIFVSCWLVSSAFVFLSENNGDPFHDYDNGRPISYWMCVYWLLVTMSTVGFGEISPTTDISRAFIVIFIIGSFAMFTSIIPELAHSLGRSSKYTKPYRRTYGKKHVVVCGNINYDNVCSFIRNFAHEDSDSKNIDVVFLHSSKPKLELEAFFKRHFSDVSFIQGTVMDLHSCQMVKMKDADVVLIMANRLAEEPDVEDAANITRATAVKNFDPKARIIIQILHQRNKAYLLQIPNWSGQKGDDVICISELKLGILGQNCLAPGFSTLISNLFTNRSYHGGIRTEWESNYRYGCGHEIYVMPISPAFVGMTFQQVTEVCFAKMNVLLVGVSTLSKSKKSKLFLNPGNQFIFHADDRAYMFAQGPEDAKKVAVYRPDKSDRQTKSEQVSSPNRNNNNAVDVLKSRAEESDDEIEYLQGIGYRLANYGERSPPPGENSIRLPGSEMFDFSGLYHWCPTRSIEEAALDDESILEKRFRGHIVLCMLAEADSPKEGLVNFVMPLRGSNLRQGELKDIIIISNEEYMNKEWTALANFPRIWLFPGHGASRSQLRYASVPQCSMCVVISATGSVNVDGHKVDKDAVLTTLNVRHVCTDDLEKKIKELGTLVNPEELRDQVPKISKNVHYITELANDSDVTLIDQEDEDDPNIPLYLTEPYVTGRIFTESVLDSLTSCTYLSSDVLTLTRALINGVDCSELELMLAEGLGFMHQRSRRSSGPGQHSGNHSRRDRCHVAQYSLEEAPLEKLQHGHCYGELFILAYRAYGFLCLGLYRLLEPNGKKDHRYVITHPPFHFQLLSSDKVFVLKPFNFQAQKPEASNAAAPLASAEEAAGPRSRNGSTRSLGKEVEVDLNTQL